MSLSRFRDKQRFQSKIVIFFHPVYLTPPLKEMVRDGYRQNESKKTKMIALPDGQKVLR